MKYSRIKKTEQFNRLFKRGVRVYSPAVTLLYLPSAEMSMGIAISKKHGGAVTRNRIKRLVRQAFYNVYDGFEGNFSIIILPKIAESYSLQQFEKGILSCARKMKASAQN